MKHTVLKAERIGDSHIRYTILMHGVKTTADITIRSRVYMHSSTFIPGSKPALEQIETIRNWLVS